MTTVTDSIIAAAITPVTMRCKARYSAINLKTRLELTLAASPKDLANEPFSLRLRNSCPTRVVLVVVDGIREVEIPPAMAPEMVGSIPTYCTITTTNKQDFWTVWLVA